MAMAYNRNFGSETLPAVLSLNPSLTTFGHDILGIEPMNKGLGVSVEKRLPGFLAGVAACLLAGGCSMAQPYTAVDGAVVIGSDKTMIDHVISLASGKNCSAVRKERGMTYCKEDEIIPRPEVYCYRELAAVTCYDKPDPRRDNRGRVGDNYHNYIKKY